MAYLKQNFTNGNVLTGVNMLNIENALTFNYSINPLIEIGSLDEYGQMIGVYMGLSSYRTAKYLRPLSTNINLITSLNSQITIFIYDIDFNFINTQTIQGSANAKIAINLPENTGYIKLTFSPMTNSSPVRITEYELKTTALNSSGGAVSAENNIQRYNFKVTQGGLYKATGAYNTGVGIGCFLGDGYSSTSFASFSPNSPFIDYVFTAPEGVHTIAVAGTTSNLPSLYYLGKSEMAYPNVTVSGVDKIEYFNIRSKDEGYQRLIIPVNVAHATVSDINNAKKNDGWTRQDELEILPDYGLLCLPKTYSNMGKPTRLIIYAHGAGVNYASNVSRFPSTDFLPEYWLAEGYAVMDIEGNPYNNEDEHFWIPEARQCYEHAYKWIVQNYNICTDGVFLGGRSMGTGTCLDLIDSLIPILAICPLAPAFNGLLLWKMYDTRRKTFIMDHIGLPKDDRPTLTSGTMSDEEWEYLKKYWAQIVKYTPALRVITNLPDADTLINATKQGAWNADYIEDEAKAYADCKTSIRKPIKLFCATNDQAAKYKRSGAIFMRMMENAGEICELRLYTTDETGDPHHLELLDSRTMIDVTTIYGETMKAPLPYVEMLQFWRRYEKVM